MLDNQDWQTYGEYLLPEGSRYQAPALNALDDLTRHLNLGIQAVERLRTAVHNSLTTLETARPVLLRIRIWQKPVDDSPVGAAEPEQPVGMLNWGFFIVEKTTAVDAVSPLPHHTLELCLYAE